MKYGDITWGQTEALINILGGAEVVLAVLRGDLKVTVEEVRKVTAIAVAEKTEQPVVPRHTSLAATVDYGMSLGQMVVAGGYDWVDSNITAQNFPIAGTGLVEYVVGGVHPNKVVTTKQGLAEMERLGLKPAAIEVLLAVGIA